MAATSAGMQTALPLRQRAAILAVVVVAHGVLLAQPWFALTNSAGFIPSELSVNIVRLPETKQIQPKQSATVFTQRPERSLTETFPEEQQPFSMVAREESVQTPPEEAASIGTDEEIASDTSILPDREPDYRASYLNNPQPSYPAVARRMAWQGRVLLNVEVLADGSAGEVAVQQGSGRAILDDAAMRAVQSWRFMPARRGGIAVTQKFLVPVKFSLQ